MKTFVYTPQISQGTACTHGYGKTVRVLIVRARDDFKTLNSPHKILMDFGTVRADYGMIKGKSARVINKAKNCLKMYLPPEPRSTVEEF